MSREKCTCPIRPGMSKQELLDEIFTPLKNCCHPSYICPTLDREMRRAAKEEGYRKYQSKKLQKAGFSDGAIQEHIRQPRKKKGVPASAMTIGLSINEL